MGIPDHAGIAAADHDALGEADNAAGVGDDVLILGIQQVQRQPVGGGGQIREVRALHGECRVNVALVDAVADKPFVVADDAAGEALAVHGSAEAAAVHRAVVVTDDAAHIVEAGNAALKAAVQDLAPVGAGDAGNAEPAVGGADAALHAQVVNERVGRDIAEKRLVRPVGGEGQSADPVPVAVEGAGEGGDGADVLAAEVQIRLQLDGDPPRPAVQRAVRRQLQKVRPVPDGYGGPGVFRRGCADPEGKPGHQQNGNQKQRE